VLRLNDARSDRSDLLESDKGEEWLLVFAVVMLRAPMLGSSACSGEIIYKVYIRASDSRVKVRLEVSHWNYKLPHSSR
jgi:hypothetical protein